MNKLKNTIIYTCGPIDRVSYKNAMDWRTDITQFLNELGVAQVINPLTELFESDGVSESEQAVEHRRNLLRECNYDELAKEMRKISNRDLHLIDLSHVIIVYYDMAVHMAGTIHELVLATQQKKPILIVCPQGKNNIPAWWFGRIPHQFFFNNFDELKEYLRRVNSGEETETYGRWYHFKS